MPPEHDHDLDEELDDQEELDQDDSGSDDAPAVSEDDKPLTKGEFKKMLAELQAGSATSARASVSDDDSDTEDEDYDPKSIRKRASEEAFKDLSRFTKGWETAKKAMKAEYGSNLTESDYDNIHDQFLSVPGGAKAAAKLFDNGTHFRLADSIVGEKIRTKKLSVERQKVDKPTRVGGSKAGSGSSELKDFEKNYGKITNPTVKAEFLKLSRGGRVA